MISASPTAAVASIVPTAVHAGAARSATPAPASAVAGIECEAVVDVLQRLDVLEKAQGEVLEVLDQLVGGIGWQFGWHLNWKYLRCDAFAMDTFDALELEHVHLNAMLQASCVF